MRRQLFAICIIGLATVVFIVVVATIVDGMLTGGPTSAGAAPKALDSGASDCNSLTTCFTPQRIEGAHGVAPLIHRGIDVRGVTVVFPEFVPSTGPGLPLSDRRLDMKEFDHLFSLPAPKR